jgi:SOS-response transcriptional repressor LexA
MEEGDNIQSHEKRRLQVYADDEDVLVRVLEIPEADYECVMVNSSWIERGLLEGDIILFASSTAAEPGDIVLIEEDGQTRLGVSAEEGFLQTANGQRQLEPSERIVGVGRALARKLRRDSEQS